MATSSFAGISSAFVPGMLPISAWSHASYFETEAKRQHEFSDEALPQAEAQDGSDSAAAELSAEELKSEASEGTSSETFSAIANAAMEPKLREQLLLQNMSTVRFVARRIHERLPQHVELEELVSAGIVGLIDAVEKYDVRKNVQFASYAQFRIRGAIIDSLRTLDWGPRDLRRKSRSIDEAMHKLTQKLGRRPTEIEVSAELGMTIQAYQHLLGEVKGLEIGSLNDIHAEGSLEEDLAYVPADPREDPLLRCMKNEMSGKLTEAVAQLPEREAMVLTLYYVEEKTMKEIGSILGVVESRVSQLHTSALATLRSRMSRNGSLPRNVPMPRANGRAQKRSHKPKQLKKSIAVPAAVLTQQAFRSNGASQAL